MPSGNGRNRTLGIARKIRNVRDGAPIASVIVISGTARDFAAALRDIGASLGGWQRASGVLQKRLLPGREEHSTSAQHRASRWRRPASDDRAGGARRDQDGLEQRRVYDPAAVTIRYSQRLGCIAMLSRPCLSRRRLRRCPEAF
jgi:hypothetical protein